MKKSILFGILAILIVLGGLYIWYGQNNKDEAMVKQVVTDFGKTLKNVSLLSTDASEQIKTTYAPFVSSDLINQWASNPTNALGRQVSSPWPDSIEITAVQKQSALKYSVSGNIIEMSSTGATDKRGITLVVEKLNNKWLVTGVTLASYNASLGWPAYMKDNLFSFKYPSDFTIQEGEGIGGAFLDNSIVKVAFPASYRDNKTNYAEAYMAVSSSTKLTNCTNFGDFPYLTNPQPQTKVINGVEFKVMQVSDAGAGNLYTSNLYRTVYENICYELSLTVHTGNIYNYPEGTVTEFDKNKAFSVLEEIANTFQFL